MVRLHAAATSSVDMNYLIKIAKTLNMTCLVTCASKPQLLNVLRNVVGLEAISVTSRNLRLWKVGPPLFVNSNLNYLTFTLFNCVEVATYESRRYT